MGKGAAWEGQSACRLLLFQALGYLRALIQIMSFNHHNDVPREIPSPHFLNRRKQKLGIEFAQGHTEELKL